MGLLRIVIVSILISLVAAPTNFALSQDLGLRVVGVAPNDVLNVREFPSAQARILEIIPDNGGGIIYLNERYGEWAFVRYGRATGWVNMKYVIPEVASWVSRGQRND